MHKLFIANLPVAQICDAMAPTPRSYQQRLGDLMNGLFAKTNLTGLRVGGPALSLLEGEASSGTRDTSDVFDALNASDPTRLRGEQLDRYGRSKGVRRPDAIAAKTDVTIGDNSFSKISSGLSPLVAPPIPGQTTLRIASALAFPSSGSIYIGRGTSSYEGPIGYSAKTDNGSDWTLTLTAAIARRHDGSEEVVLAQGGDRPVPAGTTMQTQQGNALAAATFTVLNATSIPDGEVEIVGVEALCTQRGEIGNVPAGAIAAFPSAPFSGATVTNPRRVTTGRNIMQDPDYLALIREAEASRSLGTPTALQRYSLQVTAPDEPATCTSASYVDRRGSEPAIVTIDDGTGYQPIEAVVASEPLIGSAIGGELDFELSGKPVVKARVATTVPPPWGVPTGRALAFEVGGIVTEHILDVASYPNGVEPYAVASDCNSDSRLRWEAVVAGRGQALHFRAKTELQEEIRSVTPTSAPDASTALGLSHLTEATALIYVNDRLLHRSGRPAALASRPFGQWGAISGPQTLNVDVDGTGSVTYMFVDADFAGTGYATVGRNSPAAWSTAIRRKIPGITPSTSQDILLLASNRGADATASVAVTGGSLVAAGFFAIGSATGLGADFELNRATAQGHLSSPLAPGDYLAAGSDQTRAFAESNIASPVTTTSAAIWWIALDAAAAPALIGANASTTYSASVPSQNARWWGDRLRLSAAVGTFSGLGTGDYVVFWDPTSPSSLFGYWLVAAVATDGSWFELDRRQGACLRDRTASAVLPDGRVFACGGYALSGRRVPLRTAEIFDPTTSTWTPVPGLMAAARADHWAVTLPSGKVLVGGGEPLVAGPPEIFDPGTGQFFATSTANAPTVAVGQKAARSGAIAYVAGGNTGLATYLAGTWEYDETSDTWAAGGNMLVARSRHTLTDFGGFIWAICGEDAATTLGSVEAYDTGLHTWAVSPPGLTPRQSHATTASGGFMVVTGGSTNRDAGLQTRLTNTDIYPLAGPWGAGPAMAVGRSYHTQTTTSGGKILVAGGEAFVFASELLDLAGPTWSSTGTPLLSAPLNSAISAPYGTNKAAMAFGNQGGAPVAQSQSYDVSTGLWTASDPVSGTSFSLSSGGASFGSSMDRLRRYSIAAGTDRTATNTQVDINGAVSNGSQGSLMDRVRNSRIRWRTNTWGTDQEVEPGQASGDISIAAQNLQAARFGLPAAKRDDGSAGQRAWVLSGSSEVGTPEFTYSIVAGSRGDDLPVVTWPLLAERSTWPSPVGWIRGLGGQADSYAQPRTGQIAGLAAQFRTREADARSPGGIYMTSISPEHGWQPSDRASLASPWHLGPADYLSISLNREPSKLSFFPRTYRRLKPISITYSQSGAYQDADLSPVGSLGQSFGIGYDFLDHAVFMRARALTHSADATRRLLWRWWQHGKGGEGVDLAYANPIEPSSPAMVAIDYSAPRLLAEIRLASGAAKTGAQLRSSTMVGVAAPSVSAGMASAVIAIGLSISSALRVANATTLTLVLPPGVTNHGIPLGAIVYVNSTDPNFSSGLKTVTGAAPTLIAYGEIAPNAGPSPNIGDVSRDAGPASFAGWAPAQAPGDWIRISSQSQVAAAFSGKTMRLSTIGGPQYVEAVADHFSDPPTTTLAWGQLLDPSFLVAFANPAQSASAIASQIHADYLAGISPVDPTVTGAGSGVISISTYQELASSGASYPLRDGINAVSAQVNPALPALNYSLTLRDPISSSLVANSDWTNEDVRLVPTSAAALSSWLNSAATSGFGSAGKAEPASRARCLQLASLKAGFDGAIQVSGGSANAWGTEIKGESVLASGGPEMASVVSVAAASGFATGYWAAIELSIPADRGAFSATSSLDVIRPNGELTLLNTSPKLWQAPGGVPLYQFNASVAIEIEGRFARYQDVGLGTALSLSTTLEGAWVVVSPAAAPTPGAPQISPANCGMFRIVRASIDGGSGAHCFWVEVVGNLPAVAVEADLRFLADGSILPGDKVTLGPNWGTDNAGEWTVVGLGDDGGGAYANEWTINLDTSGRSPTATFGPAPLGASHTLYRAAPIAPQRWVKRIQAMWPVGGDLAMMKLSGAAGWPSINESHGARLVALDKLEFPTDLESGRGAYRFNVGLVGEVNKVLVGSTEDTITYPGVEAAGSLVVVDGPKIRRIYFAVQVRLRSGYSASDVVVAIQGAVASSIEDRPHGLPIPVSDLIAASRVPGVAAVAPLSPYSSTEDMIPVYPGERAKVLFPSTDISVSVLGS